MSNTTITLNKEYFSLETTKAFLNDLEIACKTMETDLFQKLFTKYELIEVEEYKEVLQLIIQIMNMLIPVKVYTLFRFKLDR